MRIFRAHKKNDLLDAVENGFFVQVELYFVFLSGSTW